jgi:hypothetical protein
MESVTGWAATSWRLWLGCRAGRFRPRRARTWTAMYRRGCGAPAASCRGLAAEQSRESHRWATRGCSREAESSFHWSEVRPTDSAAIRGRLPEPESLWPCICMAGLAGDRSLGEAGQPLTAWKTSVQRRPSRARASRRRSATHPTFWRWVSGPETSQRASEGCCQQTGGHLAMWL